jgi:hypothetical protein
MNSARAKASANAGFNDVLILLNFLKQHEPPVGDPIPLELRMMRGLFFVQLYGTVEAVVLQTMSLLLGSIKALTPTTRDIDHAFYVVALSNNWKRVKDQGYKKIFSQMRNFFDSQQSVTVCEIDETLFSLYLQNISGAAIDELILAIGANIPLLLQDRVLLNELVDNRNKVAHGRESSAEVGGRYSITDLQSKLSQVQNFTYGFIAAIESFYDNREFIRPSARAGYP